MRGLLRRVWAAAAAVVVIEAANAHADETSVAVRRDLIEEAQAAREQGDHARALDRAKRAAALGRSTSLLRFIAEEEEALALPAEALGSAELCEREGAGSEAQAVHVDACRAIAARAKQEVGRIVLSVPPDLTDAQIRVRGVEVPRALWGAPYVVSPGAVDIEASAPGRRPWKTSVSVAKGAVAEVPIVLEVEAAPPPAPPEPRPAPAAPPPAPSAERSISPAVPIGAGVAVIATGVALVAGLTANAKLSDYESRCTVVGALPECVSERGELQSDLDTRALVVNVAVATAVVGAAVAVAGFFLGGRAARTPPRTAIQW